MMDSTLEQTCAYTSRIFWSVQAIKADDHQARHQKPSDDDVASRDNEGDEDDWDWSLVYFLTMDLWPSKFPASFERGEALRFLHQFLKF